MKVSEKKAMIIFYLFLVVYAAIFFGLGFFAERDCATSKKTNLYKPYKLSEAIEIINARYIKQLLSQEELKELYYKTIEAVVKELDQYSRFYRASQVKQGPRPRPENLIEERLIDKNIGYIKIPDFDDKQIYYEIEHAIKYFNQKNVKGLILDLRNNPGGDFLITIAATDLFLEKNKIIATTTKRIWQNNIEIVWEAKEKIQFKKPIVILVNDKSMSGAELFSGSLQCNQRATIIGVQTHGKGVGQNHFYFDDGSALVLTTGRYFLPNKKCPEGIGITPDIIIQDPELQLQKAIEILKAKISPFLAD